MNNFIFIVITIIFLYETSCVTHQNRLNGEYHHYKLIDDSVYSNLTTNQPFSSCYRGRVVYINDKYSVMESYKYPYLDQVMFIENTKNRAIITNSNLSVDKVLIDSILVFENDTKGYKTIRDTILFVSDHLDSFKLLIYPKYINRKDFFYSYNSKELSIFNSTLKGDFIVEFFDNGENKEDVIIEKIDKNRIAFINNVLKTNNYLIVSKNRRNGFFGKRYQRQTVSYDSIYNIVKAISSTNYKY